MCARDNGTLYREIAASVSGPPRRKLLAVAGPQISAARCESEFLNRIGRKRSSQQRYVIPGQTSVISCGRSLVSSTATRDAGPSLTPTWTVQVRLKLLGAIEHRATCAHDGPTGEPRGRRRIILAGPPLSSRGKATLGCWTTGRPGRLARVRSRRPGGVGSPCFPRRSFRARRRSGVRVDVPHQRLQQLGKAVPGKIAFGRRQPGTVDLKLNRRTPRADANLVNV